MQVAIVLYRGLTALDALGPYEVLRFLPDAEVRFVGHEVGPVVTDSGVLFLGVTHTFAETPEPDLVLVPGSAGATMQAMADEALTGWLRAVHEKTTLTTSVCSGSLVLGAAGLLKGRPATSHWMAMSALKTVGAQPQPDQRIVRDGKIVTAAGVSAGIDLALRVVADLAGDERAQMIQLAMEYDPQPPFDTGHTSKAPQHIRTLATKEMAKLNVNPRELVAMPRLAWRRAMSKLRRGLPAGQTS